MKVAVFAGPTGGHLFPALAFCQSFKERHPSSEILLVTGERGRNLVRPSEKTSGIQFCWLPDFPLPRIKNRDFLLQALPFLLKLLQAFWKTELLLNRFKPELTVGFGSYTSFPGVLASRRRKIPVLIHEQNRSAGWANAWAARLANQVAVSFERTQGFPPSISLIRTGLPIRAPLIHRAARSERKDPPLFAPGKERILVVGGSQGSQSLNRLVLETWDLFSREEKQGLAVIHITGRKEFEGIKKMYFEKGIEALVYPFHEQMEELYPEADLALTRAGANTLFEIALFRLPAVVIPFPYAEGHQELNAESFNRAGGVISLPESKVTPVRLKEKVFELLRSSDLRKQMSERLRGLARPEASRRLAELAEKLLGAPR